MKRTTALVTVALSWSLAHAAAAESKSWKAVKGSVNGSATIVVGANLDPIPADRDLRRGAVDVPRRARGRQAGLRHDQATCQIDVPTAVADVTAVMKADEKPRSSSATSTRPRWWPASRRSAHEMSGGKTTVDVHHQEGRQGHRVLVAGETKKLYVAWLATDVLAFTDDVNDKAKLDRDVKGKAPKGALGAMLGKLSTAAPVWFAATMKEKEAGIGTVTGVYGAAEIQRRHHQRHGPRRDGQAGRGHRRAERGHRRARRGQDQGGHDSGRAQAPRLDQARRRRQGSDGHRVDCRQGHPHAIPQLESLF